MPSLHHDVCSHPSPSPLPHSHCFPSTSSSSAALLNFHPLTTLSVLRFPIAYPGLAAKITPAVPAPALVLGTIGCRARPTFSASTFAVGAPVLSRLSPCLDPAGARALHRSVQSSSSRATGTPFYWLETGIGIGIVVSLGLRDGDVWASSYGWPGTQ
jgi:hypothetical protein